MLFGSDLFVVLVSFRQRVEESAGLGNGIDALPPDGQGFGEVLNSRFGFACDVHDE